MMKNKEQVKKMINELCMVDFGCPEALQCDISAALVALDWVIGRIDDDDILASFSAEKESK